MIADTIEINGSTRDTILNKHPMLYEQFDTIVEPLPGGSWVDKVQLRFLKGKGTYRINCSCTDPYQKDEFVYEIDTSDGFPYDSDALTKARWNFKILRLWYYLKAESLGEV